MNQIINRYDKMTKLEKSIIYITCKYIVEHQESLKLIDDEAYSFKLDNSVITDFVGISYDKLTEFFEKLRDLSLIDSVKKIQSRLGDIALDDGWDIQFNLEQLHKLFDIVIENKHLNKEQLKVKAALDDFSNKWYEGFFRNTLDGAVEESFKDGQWLRLCCSACGDFIQEITTYEELRKLEGVPIECKRKKHKTMYKLRGENIEFSSSEVKILRLLRDKRP